MPVTCLPVTNSHRPRNIDVVGLHLTAADLAPLQSNVDAIQRLPDPTCLAQVALFLGMTAYYLRSLPSTPQKRSIEVINNESLDSTLEAALNDYTKHPSQTPSL
ncbi:unnamed protein product [Merluccius merluccius]